MWLKCQNVTQGGGTSQVEVQTLNAESGTITFGFVPDKVFVYCANSNYFRMSLIDQNMKFLALKANSQNYFWNNPYMTLNGNTLTIQNAAATFDSMTHYIVAIKE